ncbi:hypothetical protein E2C01_070344 [Portunus trituberculatus]|uniref:Uncharacterized protein n=1 Tax=Portunus trituberculatus TaxID=210409 RepID=A0A5B7I562_PORTR|nr:hypothetical protein [Portunus trituberculatus]
MGYLNTDGLAASRKGDPGLALRSGSVGGPPHLGGGGGGAGQGGLDD